MKPTEQKDALTPREGEIACESCGLTMAESHTLYDLKRGAVVLAQTQNNEILALHRQLAGEKLRADQGWARAEAKSRECIELRERMAAGSGQPANELSAADVDQNILSVALWLYRRLPHCYGRPPHVEGPIKALARRVSTDVADCLAERGPDTAEGGAQ